MLNSKLFDHTILKPDASKEAVEKICKEALQYDFASVCVNQYRTKMVADMLKGSDVKVCTVVGFPLGAVSTEVKVFETKAAINDGATEIDMVINVGAIKDGDYEYVENDIRKVKEACGDITLKVIIETCLLTDEQKEKACELSMKANADFVKTSTGFSTGGATKEDVALMRKTVGAVCKVKASGGIRDAATAKLMVDAGADRLGTSATVNIIL
ncbi:MAG: deoxyribose-phosphate aldolase [Lachnospiraceae bacterium]|nr:deoxyribose-phosphate aldolase [Lachnospiraceae bacterium]